MVTVRRPEDGRCRREEARAGIEPANGSFADSCLTTWLPRRGIASYEGSVPVIAGAATVGLEIAEDAPDVDVIIVGCGGGGLLSGIAAAIHETRPRTRVIGVEPSGADAMRQSLARGSPVRLPRLNTIADGLAAPFAGVHTLAHVQAYVDQMVLVEDMAILEAMRALMRKARIVPEPAAAAATAALLGGFLMIEPAEHVVVVVSGGNVDPERVRSLL